MDTEESTDLPESSAEGVFEHEGFIADVFDVVNCFTIDGFNSMETFLARTLDVKSEEDRQALKEGVDSVYGKVQDNLDDSLNRWESICRIQYFAFPVKPLASSRSKKKIESTAASVDDAQEEMLDAELKSLRSQLTAAHREGAKMRTEVASLEKQFALRKEILCKTKSLTEGLDFEELQEVIRSVSLLQTRVAKATRQRNRLQPSNVLAEASMEEQIAAVKMPYDMEKCDMAIENLIG